MKPKRSELYMKLNLKSDCAKQMDLAKMEYRLDDYNKLKELWDLKLDLVNESRNN